MQAPEKTCHACLSVIPQAAVVCRACGTRLEGIQCSACRSFCPDDASLCRHCGSRLNKTNQNLPVISPMVIQADPLATLLLEWSLNPQRLALDSHKITLTSFSLFGLTAQHEELPWEKVAGFNHRAGLFWDAIAIETRGQTAANISCLTKRDAQRLKRVLQSVERERLG